MSESTIIIALVIFTARVCDVGLGTVRYALIARGRKLLVFIIALVEALIWIYAVSRVMSSIQNPFTSFAFALGFATGTSVGMTIEGILKIGEQVIRIFSISGNIVASQLREKGYRVTVFDGRGRDGTVQLLFVQAQRKKVSKVIATARHVDPKCFITVDDIHSVHIAKYSPDGGEDLLSAPLLVTNEGK